MLSLKNKWATVYKKVSPKSTSKKELSYGLQLANVWMAIIGVLIGATLSGWSVYISLATSNNATKIERMDSLLNLSTNQIQKQNNIIYRLDSLISSSIKTTQNLSEILSEAKGQALLNNSQYKASKYYYDEMNSVTSSQKRRASYQLIMDFVNPATFNYSFRITKLRLEDSSARKADLNKVIAFLNRNQSNIFSISNDSLQVLFTALNIATIECLNEEEKPVVLSSGFVIDTARAKVTKESNLKRKYQIYNSISFDFMESLFKVCLSPFMTSAMRRMTQPVPPKDTVTLPLDDEGF